MKPRRVLRGRAQHGVELPLADDHVHLAAHAGVREQLGDVQQPARRAVDRVLRAAVAEQRPRDRHLGVVDRQRTVGVVDRQRDLGPAERRAAGGAGEDDVLHRPAAQRLGALLAHHPGERVDHVGLARPVRADDAGDPRFEAQRRRRGERLEAPQGQRLEVHGASLGGPGHRPGNHRAISAARRLRASRSRARGSRRRRVPQSRPRSPRIVPGAAGVGSVVPASERKPSTTRCPSATTASTGPDDMNSTQRAEERLAHVLGVVRGEQRGVGGAQLDGHEGVALRLDAAQHLPDQAAADGVGLDQDERALGGGGGHGRKPSGWWAWPVGSRRAGGPLAVDPAAEPQAYDPQHDEDQPDADEHRHAEPDARPAAGAPGAPSPPPHRRAGPAGRPRARARGASAPAPIASGAGIDQPQPEDHQRREQHDEHLESEDRRA